MAKEYIERDQAIRAVCDCRPHSCDFETDCAMGCQDVQALIKIPAADVVSRDCYDRLLAENDELRKERTVRHGHKVTHNRPIAGHWVSGKLDGGWDDMEGRVWVPPVETNPVDYCSECGKRLDDTFQRYCPNCGAKWLRRLLNG